MSAPDSAALRPGRSWDEMRRDFRWRYPARMNLAEQLVGARAAAEPDRLALRHLHADGRAEDWSFARLDRAGRRFANALAGRGIAPGERVAIQLAQSPEALIAHLGCYRLGAIPVLLSTLFGGEALGYRLRDSGAAAIIADAARLARLDGLELPDLRHRVCAEGAAPQAETLEALLEEASETPLLRMGAPDDPAFLSYTSGTTGPPKGALLPNRVLYGHLPACALVHDFAPHPGDVFWTPADWAWMGGLCNIAMPALHWGAALISHRMEKFDPEAAFRLMADQGVNRVFMPPTALRLLRQAPEAARKGLSLASIGSGGEALGAELLGWGREALGLEIAEFYGQTECNLMISSNARLFAPRPGAMGKATPGFDVAVLDASGAPLPLGQEGEIAVQRGAGSMFLGYWNQPKKTAEKFSGDWMRTGDEGVMDEDGVFRFAARSDDVITSAGYRIGPSEIEDCLCGRPEVALAAVVGLPDELRTEIVAAFVKPAAGVASDEALKDALVAHVREKLGGHVAPRRVEFVDDLPTTVTGKLMRREVKRRALEG